MTSKNENIESNNQIELADFIKNVHKQLREKYKLLAEEAWENHCADEICLKQYAAAMKELATNHWEKNSKDVTRIIWTYNISNDYFAKDIFNQRTKEFGVAEKIDLKIQPHSEKVKTSFKLLDVGSCYNPFNQFDCFEVIAIDIAPAVSDVIHCDFLKLEVGGETTYFNNKLVKLPNDYFDIIVFSLFLEYLPSPSQRKVCCEKAYRLLSTEGILVLITPDSNHIGSNSKVIKSWQFILAEIGFSRIKYEKLSHLHCMAFRKAFSKKITRRWAELHRKKQVYDQIYIPQDFSTTLKSVTTEKVTNKSSTTREILNFIEELPFCDSIS
ncbi:S-adenosylmethionine sensor upstream of TORC1 [Leptinotarsa decemlineata]|uniref:S-adenosylmethionine sensor upstream of TORC1 n=1 Tax=Leptinotarsa decemlineata TaxID=7539 RepID=UPI003D30D052